MPCPRPSRLGAMRPGISTARAARAAPLSLWNWSLQVTFLDRVALASASHRSALEPALPPIRPGNLVHATADQASTSEHRHPSKPLVARTALRRDPGRQDQPESACHSALSSAPVEASPWSTPVGNDTDLDSQLHRASVADRSDPHHAWTGHDLPPRDQVTSYPSDWPQWPDRRARLPNGGLCGPSSCRNLPLRFLESVKPTPRTLRQVSSQFDHFDNRV
jgi:hypothetical protein